MPDAVTQPMIWAVLIPVCIVTVLLRQLPFAFIKQLRSSDLVGLLGRMMPVGVMTVLVVYTVTGQAQAPGGIPVTLLGVTITLGLHLLFKRTEVSIIGGTLAYMALVNLVF